MINLVNREGTVIFQATTFDEIEGHMKNVLGMSMEERIKAISEHRLIIDKYGEYDNKNV